MSQNQKLFVGNLSFRTSEQELSDFISGSLPVLSAKIITDRDTGRSKGFAFVEVEGENDAVDNLIQELSGKELGGRSIRIDKAKPQERKPGGGGGPRRRHGMR